LSQLSLPALQQHLDTLREASRFYPDFVSDNVSEKVVDEEFKPALNLAESRSADSNRDY
jgi:hypothetical protein